jgi:hypothetical protein
MFPFCTGISGVGFVFYCSVLLSLPALEHDCHDGALRSVGATHVFVFTSALEIPFSFSSCVLLSGWILGVE